SRSLFTFSLLHANHLSVSTPPFLFSHTCSLRDLPSFPTRRSSDLVLSKSLAFQLDSVLEFIAARDAYCVLQQLGAVIGVAFDLHGWLSFGNLQLFCFSFLYDSGGKTLCCSGYTIAVVIIENIVHRFRAESVSR